MKALDVMVRDVVTVSPDADVKEAIKLLAEHDISALPVVDADGNVVGVISEGDLIRREELGTEKRRPWWLEAVTPASTLAEEFAKSHGRRVSEVMSTHVVSATEETPLGEIATLLEKHRIKRVPIMRDGKLVGIVSRSNLIQALASLHPQADTHSEKDREIRLDLLSRLGDQPWTDFGSRNVIVTGGAVHLWGLVGSEEERKAADRAGGRGARRCSRSGRDDRRLLIAPGGNALTLGRRLARPFLRELGEFPGKPICTDVLGIEVISGPFAEFGVAFVLGIVDGLKELGVAPGATDVFGGTTSDGLDQARVNNIRLGGDEALDLDRVFPAIAKIVEVTQRLCADLLKHIAKASLARIERAITAPLGIGIAPSHVPCADSRRGGYWSSPSPPGWQGAAGRARCRLAPRSGAALWA